MPELAESLAGMARSSHALSLVSVHYYGICLLTSSSDFLSSITQSIILIPKTVSSSAARAAVWTHPRYSPCELEVVTVLGIPNISHIIGLLRGVFPA